MKHLFSGGRAFHLLVSSFTVSHGYFGLMFVLLNADPPAYAVNLAFAWLVQQVNDLENKGSQLTV